jgi:glycolate oxidase iron-sulfur subunit
MITDCEAALDAGCETIVSTASGCGVVVKDYAQLLRSRPELAAAARRIAAATRDLSEVIDPAELRRLRADETGAGALLAFQSPCTLQHGQRLSGRVEHLLKEAGLPPRIDQTRSRGSAAVIKSSARPRARASRTQAQRAARGSATTIAANVGCLAHLAAPRRCRCGTR